MRVLCITYDLRSPGRNYESLYTAIKALGSWCHPLESTWVVSTGLSAEAVRDRLRGAIDRNDGLLVTRLTNEAAWYGLSKELDDWLFQTLSVASAA